MTNKSFKQYLAEADKTISFKDLLHGECSAYFRQSQKNGMIVRGLAKKGELVGKVNLGPEFNNLEFDLFKKTVRKNRRAMDTAANLSKVIDDWFEEEHGIRARSEAVFCFGEAGRANAYMYGPVCAVFPIGKFTYVWSPKVVDLYDDISLGKIQHDGDVKAQCLGSDGKVDPDIIKDIMDGLGYTINGFDKAVTMANEIMIDCDEYYVIPLAIDEETREKTMGALKKAFVHA